MIFLLISNSTFSIYTTSFSVEIGWFPYWSFFLCVLIVAYCWCRFFVGGWWWVHLIKQCCQSTLNNVTYWYKCKGDLKVDWLMMCWWHSYLLVLMVLLNVGCLGLKMCILSGFWFFSIVYFVDKSLLRLWRKK